MNGLHNEKLVPISQTLRKNMTPEERHLWYDFLKPRGIPARRQKILGPYVVDFYIAEAKTVIELDGSQHYGEKGLREDALRDRYLQAHGIRVLRYSNADVRRNFSAVCEDILREIDLKMP